MKKVKLFFLFAAISVFTDFMFAQSDSSKTVSIRTNIFTGVVLPEYNFYDYLIQKPAFGMECSLTKKTTGKTLWEQLYKYPEYGLTFFYTTIGNKNVFGNELAIFPYVKTFLINTSIFKLTNEFGLGLGYATKKFDIKTDYENVAIGSHLNIHFNYKLGTTWVFTRNFSLSTGLSFTHFSNANMAEPNLGINIVSVFAGVNYAIGQKSMIKKQELEKHQPKQELAFVYAPGGRHSRALDSKVYFTSSISVEYKYHLKRKLHIGGGLDLFYDSSSKVEMSVSSNEPYKSIYDYKSGIHISQEILYDRFSVILQEGVYVGLIDHINGSYFYNRAILRWKFTNHFFMNISMKSHLNILDYPELGFGYYVTSKK